MRPPIEFRNTINLFTPSSISMAASSGVIGLAATPFTFMILGAVGATAAPALHDINLLLEVADDGGLSSASRSACDRPSGDGRAGHPLGGSEVGHRARPGRDGHGDVSL